MVSKVKYLILITLILHFFFMIPIRAIAFSDEDKKKSLSVFPILMYDTDIGVGYGGKAKFINYLSRKESFDFILFNSSKGERWYVFTFSIPDFEIRQGKRYPISFDLRAEYDKFLKYSFYGFGVGSCKENETIFTYERKELQIKIGRGFTPHFVIEAHYVLKEVDYFNVEEGRPYTETLRGVGGGFSPYATFIIRFDTSDSQIHPRRGFRLLFQNDLASEILGNKNANYYRFTLDFRKYNRLFGQKDVLALRALVKKISGKEIPIFEMPVLGGGSEITAMRGYARNRFIDKGKFLINAEYRFPIWKKLGGNIFIDGGLIWPSWSNISLDKGVVDLGWGLRYYLKNFVVRFDMGFSEEGTGIYFDFNHIF
ncbi:MAG: BamA/TamA family outer membrane protein [Candidatus Aminicenantes bacterium]|nr:MAG: BamA/TamA family outer membrane protein [Candidatus Aminicenantes bacterium]